MKKLLVLFALLFSVSLINAQTTVVILCDTTANSQTESGVLDLDQFAPATVDSIDFLVYASGEADIDSIAIHGGVKVQATYPANSSSRVQVSEWEEIGSIEGTLTIDVADGVETVVEGFPATVGAATLNGYNSLKIFVYAGAAGNDATDTGQKVMVVARVFTSQ